MSMFESPQIAATRGKPLSQRPPAQSGRRNAEQIRAQGRFFFPLGLTIERQFKQTSGRTLERCIVLTQNLSGSRQTFDESRIKRFHQRNKFFSNAHPGKFVVGIHLIYPNLD